MQLCCIQNRTVGTWVGTGAHPSLNFNIIEKRTNRNKQFIIIVFLQIYGPSIVPAIFLMDILSFVCFIILHTKTEEVILMSTTKSSTMGWNTFLMENSCFHAPAFSREIRVKDFFEGPFLFFMHLRFHELSGLKICTFRIDFITLWHLSVLIPHCIFYASTD